MSPNYLPVGDDVFSVIRYLGQQNSPLELTKSFKGIMVRQDVDILEVNPDRADAAFRVTGNEQCAALDGEVYLHSNLFPRLVTAQLKSLDLIKGELVLSGFTYQNRQWKNRQHERVQPKHPTYVTLRWKGIAIRACLLNISAAGMGILAYKLIEKGIKIQAGSNIHLDFQFYPDQKYTALKGKIIYINTSGRSLSTMGIRLFPKAKEAHQLESYISHRKQEILDELDRVYQEKSKPRGVESLCF